VKFVSINILWIDFIFSRCEISTT